MKIIDFKKKGNVVRFFLGKDGLKEWGGDDWNDRPYEHNAGEVYEEYVAGYRDVFFPFNFAVVEPKDGNWNGNSDWCKDDMKERKIPCIIAIRQTEEEDWNNWHDDDFMHWVGGDSPDIIKFYFGDKMEPGQEVYE